MKEVAIYKYFLKIPVPLFNLKCHILKKKVQIILTNHPEQFYTLQSKRTLVSIWGKELHVLFATLIAE